MSRVTCSSCGGTLDSRTMQNCLDCGSYVCPECSKMYNGFCEECYDMISTEFD
ncbi:MAG: hypothetical protein ACOX6S_12945 [Clostridia bacterium]